MAIEIDLSGHVALVTGAAGELGRPITRTLARCGADVVIHYHTSRDKAEKLLAEVQATGVRAMTVQADVTDERSVMAMKEAVVAELGDPDVLVHNAVSQSAWKTILEQSVQAYEDQFRSCVLQTVLMAKAFVPAMIARRYGRIVVINTESAMQCWPNQSAYAAAKRGLDGIVRVLAREIGEHQITVNQVAPGWMISDRTRAAGSQRQPSYEEKVPLGHRGEDQEIAHAVAFLASDLARFITGVYLPVCGGAVMPGI
jgi:3-oxoacyl-[acyl-carrier protein] reductase